ncbi:MAG: NUDIX domain-containing protein, partial [Patescibacteria group bacterium]
KKGRPGWSVNHALAAVYYMKQLLKHEKGTSKILVATMYLHDIGDAKTFKNKKHGIDEQIKKKKDQMKYSAALSKKILSKINDFSESEIKIIVNLVKKHDIIEMKRNHNEQLVFEADSLGMIDRKRAPSTITNTDERHFINLFEKTRIPRFKTKMGLKYLEKIFPIYKQKKFEKKPTQGIIAIFYKKENNKKLYLVIKNTDTGNITFVAGKKNPADKSLLETAKREIKEELGLNPNQYQLIPTKQKHEFIFSSKKSERVGQPASYNVYLINAAKLNINHTKELSWIKWLTKSEVLKSLTFPDLKTVFKKSIK